MQSYVRIAATLLIIATVMIERREAASMGHSHHVKRQQPNLPQLTLTVEPLHGVEPPSHIPIPDYHFPVDSGLFNFTCTIKHPQHRYKLSISREQTKLNGQKAVTDFIDPSDYKIHPDLAVGDRMAIEYSEPTFLDQGATYIRVTLLIKNLKIEDNGVYICKYSNIVKKINAIVYKVATENDITMNLESGDNVRLNSPVELTCRVSNVYPKPRIILMHSLRENIQTSVKENDVSIVEDEFNPYHLYTLTATYNFTPSYSDNNQNFMCTVISQGNTNATVSSRPFNIKVEGTQIIDKECHRGVVGKPGENDFKIACVFFSNPRFDGNSYWETNEEVESSVTSSGGGSDSSVVVGGGGESTSHGDDQVATSTQSSEPLVERKIMRIFEHEERQNYAYSLEDYSAEPNTGLYRAVLKIKTIRPSDLKNYTFRVDDHVRTIMLFDNEKQKDQLLNESNSASALVKFHSMVLIFNLILIVRALFGF